MAHTPRYLNPEEIEEDSAFPDEAAFHAFLASLDLSKDRFSNRYWRWILREMKVL